MAGIIEELGPFGGAIGTEPTLSKTFTSPFGGDMGIIVHGEFNSGRVYIDVSPSLIEDVWAEVESLRFTSPGYKAAKVFGRRMRLRLTGQAAEVSLRVFLMNSTTSTVLRSDN